MAINSRVENFELKLIPGLSLTLSCIDRVIIRKRFDEMWWKFLSRHFKFHNNRQTLYDVTTGWGVLGKDAIRLCHERDAVHFNLETGCYWMLSKTNQVCVCCLGFPLWHALKTGEGISGTTRVSIPESWHCEHGGHSSWRILLLAKILNVNHMLRFRVQPTIAIACSTPQWLPVFHFRATHIQNALTVVIHHKWICFRYNINMYTNLLLVGNVSHLHYPYIHPLYVHNYFFDRIVSNI